MEGFFGKVRWKGSLEMLVKKFFGKVRPKVLSGAPPKNTTKYYQSCVGRLRDFIQTTVLNLRQLYMEYNSEPVWSKSILASTRHNKLERRGLKLASV